MIVGDGFGGGQVSVVTPDEQGGGGDATGDDGVLEQRVASLENHVGEIRATLSRMEPMLARIDERLNHTATKAEIAGIEERLSQTATKAEVAAIEERLSQTATKTEVAAMEERLSQTATKAEIAGVEGQLSQTVSKTEFAATNERLGYMATKADLIEKPGKGYLWGVLGVLVALTYGAVLLGASLD